MNGLPIRASNSLIEQVEKSKGSPIKVVYRRDGQKHETTVTAQWVKDETGNFRWRIGAGSSTP